MTSGTDDATRVDSHAMGPVAMPQRAAQKTSGITAPEATSSIKRSVDATPHRFRDLLALDDFERHARRLLPPMIFHYVAGGVETGAALRGSREAYAGYKLVPRMLRDVSGRDQGVTLFGRRYDAPFGIPPLGGAAFIAYRGDLVLAEAASKQSLPMILSASSLISLEDVHARN